jgi:lipopolysaccharide heptosyltransferase I
MNILIVRLGALGDIVHAIPAAAALRRAFPGARLDWLVEAKHRAILDMVTALDRVVAIGRPSVAGWTHAVRELRATKYDLAIDLQGLMKSAVLARASGAARVVGFSIWHLREKTARPFYSDVREAEGDHVIAKNLRLLEAAGVHDTTIEFPIADAPSAAVDQVRAAIGGGTRFALVNPGAAWPNKRWPAERFGEIAAFLRDACALTPVVLWGPGEEALAQAVVTASSGAAVLAPPTAIPDIVALARAAALFVSGDTGPLHLAMAAGTPSVGIFGPTDPVRNGAFTADDLTVSRYDACGCHYDRRCHQTDWCLASLPSSEVCAALQRRLAGSARG